MNQGEGIWAAWEAVVGKQCWNCSAAGDFCQRVEKWGIYIPDRRQEFFAKEFDVTCHMSLHVFTFDENLHEHINRDLADDVGRESDTS